MTETDQDSGDVFDVDRVRRLVEMMQEHDLSEVSLRQGDQRIKLKRGPDQQVGGYVMPPPAPVAPPLAAPARSAPAAPSNPSAEEDDPNITYVNSPTVGTFYTRPNPESDPFVKIGDHIGPDSVVCVIEAMKVFNEIPAGVSGQVVAILVENEDTVDFDKPLFKVDTSK